MELLASLNLALPELALALGAMLFLLIGVFQGDRALPGVTWGAAALLLGAALYLLDDPARAQGFGGLYVADRFSAFLKTVILAAAAAAAVIALPWLRRTPATARFEYPILLLFGALGMCLMVSAGDLLTLYIGLELQSLAAYVLAGFHRQDSRSAEAGMKYFVLGALASGILLFGASLVYGFAGTTSFAGLGAAISGEPSLGALVGMVFILVGLAFKVSAVPFHMWTPDVYEGAPTPVVAFFAAAPKVAAMGLLARVAVEAFGGATEAWRQIVTVMAIGSMLLGALAAIGQTNLKRLLAYSSINNVGFALIGLAAGSQAGLAGLLFYMAVYAAMTVGAFACLIDLRDLDGRPVETIAGLAGLARTRPGLALALAVFMFSLAGIPPLLGFWPKFSVFQAGVEAGLWPLVVIGVIASVVAAYYYLRIVKTMYFDEAAGPVAPRQSLVGGTVIAAAALFCSPLGMLLIPPIVGAARAAAASLG
jgi:NADH-quinone oxidoreductase subunit N